MKVKCLLIALTLVCAHNTMEASARHSKTKERKMISTNNDIDNKKAEQDCRNSNRCYCSVKCGYRDRTQGDDPVYYPGGIKIGDEMVHCFCKIDDLKEVLSKKKVCRGGEPSPRRMKK